MYLCFGIPQLGTPLGDGGTVRGMNFSSCRDVRINGSDDVAAEVACGVNIQSQRIESECNVWSQLLRSQGCCSGVLTEAHACFLSEVSCVADACDKLLLCLHAPMSLRLCVFCRPGCVVLTGLHARRCLDSRAHVVSMAPHLVFRASRYQGGEGAREIQQQHAHKRV